MRRNIKLFEEFSDIPNLGIFYSRINTSKLSKNNDDTYDYDGSLNFSSMGLKSLTEIPIKFKIVNGNFDSDPNPFKKTDGTVKSISKMSYETQMKQLNFLGKVDIKAYDIFLEILEELGVNVSLRKELSNISKTSGLDDIGF